MKGKSHTYTAIFIAILLIVAISVVSNSLSGFSGTDDKAVEMIHEINPSYQPTTKPLVKTMSPEISSMLFALQAAIGAGIIGYYIGYSRRKTEEDHQKNV